MPDPDPDFDQDYYPMINCDSGNDHDLGIDDDR